MSSIIPNAKLQNPFLPSKIKYLQKIAGLNCADI